MKQNERGPILTAIIAGLVGAIAIDLYLMVSLTLFFKGTPLLLMQWDASNALGAAAYGEGWTAAIVGTLMHFAVSIAWGALFVAVALRARWLTEHPIASGAVLGIVAMVVMRAVIHLGHALIRPFSSFEAFLNNVIAHLVFGVAVALVVAKRLPDRNKRFVDVAGGVRG